jgi:hypothetical protein
MLPRELPLRAFDVDLAAIHGDFDAVNNGNRLSSNS